MKIKPILFFILLSSIFVSCTKQNKNIPVAKNGIIDLSEWDFDKNPSANLAGEWEFYWKQLLEPSDIDTNKTVEYLQTPAAWSKSKNKKYSEFGYATYRLKIILPKNHSNLKPDFSRIFSASKIWINGDFMLASGKVATDKENEIVGEYKYYKLLSQDIKTFRDTMEIVIQVSNFHFPRNKNGILRNAIIAKTENILFAKLLITGFNSILLAIMFIIGFYHLTAYFFKPNVKYNLIFFFITLICIIRTFYTGRFYFYFFDNIEFIELLDYLPVPVYPFLMVLFFFYLFKGLVSRLSIVIISIPSVFFTLIIAFSDLYIKTILTGYLGVFVISVLFYLFYVSIKAYRLKMDGAIWALLAAFFMIITTLIDLLISFGVLNIIYTASTGMALYMIVLTFDISDRYAKSLKHSETLTTELEFKNLNLEIIVENRTSEIKKQNNILVQQKEEINTQKEELQSINEELLKLNIDFEKLSKIASETNNAIAIFDKNLNLEWNNLSFKNLYKLSFDNTPEQFNLFTLSNNSNIKEIVNECIKTQKSVKYEITIRSKNKEEKWVQTTMTPVFDKEQFSKLIAIESDITDIKLAGHKIDFQNRLIKSSIEYAKTIQTAILPKQQNIDRYLNNYIIYRPKDIVSGDFYWFFSPCDEVTEVVCRIMFIAVVDCTGHGVPGAFMSMISSSLLQKIVVEQRITSPKEIIHKLDLEIIKALRQEETENQDGMDIGLCRIVFDDNDNANIIFCGAKLSAFCYFNKTDNINRIKGDNKSVGGARHRTESVFTDNELNFAKNDQLFLTTDGYIDQNNILRKRFSTQQFEKCLSDVVKMPFENQQEKLEQILDNWQNGTEQRDDITVIGIKF